MPWRLVAAELTVLRRKRGMLSWSLIVTVGALLLFFIVPAIEHANDPTHHQPAGGTNGFGGGVHVLGLIVGPLAAILIGVQAGAGDLSAGVFRDLVTSGRSRMTLFVARVPAALGLLLPLTLASFVALVVAADLLAGGGPTPSIDLVLRAGAYVVIAQSVTCIVAVGAASLLGSRTGALVGLIGWQLIVSRLLATAQGLGSVRQALLTTALQRFDPIGTPALASTSWAIAIGVVVAWSATFLAAGAWRTKVSSA